MKQIKFWLATSLCLGLGAAGSLRAAVINAASGAYADVTNAVAHATFGDTVQLPAGTWTWTNSEMTFSGITIAGMGTNATILIDNLPGPSAANNWRQFNRFMIAVPVTNALTRITGITFQDGGNPLHDFKGKIEFDGRASTALKWRIDHCQFVKLNGDNLYVHGNANGLVDHCTFILQGTAINHYGISMSDSYGDVPYATPPGFGTANALYVEDCYFTNVIPNSSSSAVYDGYAGGKSVFRNNTVWNTFWEAHGNDTSQRYRGTRSFEIYNNSFLDNQNFVTAMDFRSGTGVIFSNTVVGYKIFSTIENYRNVQPNYWGGVNGASLWDSNSPTIYLSGIYTGTNGATSLTVNGANWTPGQWTGYVLVNTNSGRFDLIQNNTANQISLTAPKDLAPMTFTNGDAYEIHYVGAALDQVGRGSGDMVIDSYANWPNITTVNTVGNAAGWPHQVLEPLYSWGNTLNGNLAGVTSSYANIQEGREIYFNTPKPGYTPFTYPHPLQSSSTNSTGSGSTGGSTTNQTANLQPPTGLQVIPQ
ncbi:MAG TPA: hypothetical protein VF607_16210 [Verrucomicrobiae bacterium]